MGRSSGYAPEAAPGHLAVQQAELECSSTSKPAISIRLTIRAAGADKAANRGPKMLVRPDVPFRGGHVTSRHWHVSVLGTALQEELVEAIDATEHREKHFR